MMMQPKPPPGLRTSGRSLWKSVTDEFDVSGAELALLLQAARVADLLDELQATVQAEGATVADPAGGSKPHPVAVELRQQRLALARLLAALRVPDADDVRPQRRAGVRGFYDGAR